MVSTEWERSILHAYLTYPFKNELDLALYIIELESSLIPTFSPYCRRVAVLESSMIELESSLIQLQSAANESVRFLIVHI